METKLLAVANNAFKSYKKANYMVDIFEDIGLLVDGGKDFSGFGELYGIMTDAVDIIMACFDIQSDDPSLVEKIQMIVEGEIERSSRKKKCDSRRLSKAAIDALIALGKQGPESVSLNAEERGQNVQ